MASIRPYDPVAGQSAPVQPLPVDPTVRPTGNAPVPADVPALQIPDREGVTASEDSVLPPELVGTWDTQGPSSLVSYRFDDDGVFGSAALLWQERPSGTWWYEVSAAGVATVDGGVLVLDSHTGRHRVADPDDPAENFDRPLDPEMSERSWEVRDGGTILVLTDEYGATKFRRSDQE